MIITDQMAYIDCNNMSFKFIVWKSLFPWSVKMMIFF